MAANAGALRFVITASNQAGGPLAAVRRSLAGLVPAATATNRQIDLFQRNLRRAPLGGFARQALDAAKALKDVSTPLGTITSAASIAGMARLTSQWSQFGTQLGFAAARLQTNEATLHGMQGAARLLGGTADDLTSSFEGFATAMTDAAGGRNSEVVGYLDMLGISMRNARGEVNKGRDGFLQLADAVARIKDPQLQIMLMRAFGVSEKLWPVMRRGSAAFREYEQEARRYGGWTGKGTAAATAFSQAQSRVGQALEGVASTIAERFGPPATSLLNWLARAIADHRELAAVGTVAAAVLGGPMLVAVGRLAASFVGIGSTLAALRAFRPPAWLLPLLGAAAVGGVGALAGERDREDADRAKRGEGPGPTLGERIKRQLEEWGVQFQDPNAPPPTYTTPGAVRRFLEPRGWSFRDDTAAGRPPPALPPGIGEQVARIANLGGVRAAFATAIARNEAGTGKVSPAGAIGTMQLMPTTARMLGVDPNDQTQNVVGGVKYLRMLLEQFHGNELAAGAAYNAGPNHPGVRRFAETGDRSRLPRETQTYLSRLEAQGIQGTVQVQIDLGNAPPGTRATARSSSPAVRVDPVRVQTAMPSGVAP